VSPKHFSFLEIRKAALDINDKKPSRGTEVLMLCKVKSEHYPHQIWSFQREITIIIKR
jgi:hypothetical protein